jgi:hypothetical protein
MRFRLLWAAALLTLAGHAAPPQETFTLSGPGQVVDGWIASTGGGQAFDTPTLRADGQAWETYYRVLLRFDVGRLEPARFAQVRRATLRLTALTADNPKAVPVRLAACDTAWTPAATFSAPTPGQGWPQRNEYGNPDYAMLPEDEVSQVIAAPGAVDVDITSLVEQWLYEGRPNYGLLLAVGPPIFGKPDAGAWALSFAASESGAGGPTLTVELAGDPPTPADLPARTLRWYPSAWLPPVRSPYLFMWYFGEPPRYPGAVANSCGGSDEAAQRGMLPLSWFYGPNNPWLKSEQAFVDAYVRVARSGTLGIMVDEWQPEDEKQEMLKPGNPYAITGSLKGMVEAKHLNPAMLITVAWRGEETIAPVTAQGLPDFLLVEAYTHLSRKFPREWALDGDLVQLGHRLDTARRLGLIEQTIPWFGMVLAPDDYHPGERLTPELIDRQLARAREIAPEMPGVAFYANGDNALAVAADQLTAKHYVAPAPDVVLTTPAFQSVLTTPHVTLRARATGKDARPVVRYRWFIDQRLMAESSTPTWVWDLRGEVNGPHVATVHAVDAAWNRAAAQMPVTVALPDRTAGL